MTTAKLKHLFNQVANNPNCIACLLTVYGRHHQLEDMEMANLLAVDLFRFYQLGILFVPASNAELLEVAAAHEVAPDKLSKILQDAKTLL